jgi:hypothetical protein
LMKEKWLNPGGEKCPRHAILKWTKSEEVGLSLMSPLNFRKASVFKAEEL